MTAPSRGLSTSTGAVVRKPSGKEPAGCGPQRCRGRYGDFDAAAEDAAADDVAGGMIAEPRGGSDEARVRWATGVRGRSGPCGVLARTSAVAAGPGPARQIGTAAANEVARAHEVSILMAAGIAVGRCRGRLACLEHLDDAHGRAAARAGLEGRGRIGSDVFGLGRRRSDVEQLAGEREVVGLHAARQQTVVADAVEALGQHVDQEAADELVRRRASSSCSGRVRRSDSP